MASSGLRCSVTFVWDHLWDTCSRYHNSIILFVTSRFMLGFKRPQLRSQRVLLCFYLKICVFDTDLWATKLERWIYKSNVCLLWRKTSKFLSISLLIQTRKISYSLLWTNDGLSWLWNTRRSTSCPILLNFSILQLL